MLIGRDSEINVLNEYNSSLEDLFQQVINGDLNLLHIITKFYHTEILCQGTGSYPHPPPGLHFDIRFIPNKTP